MPRHYDPCVLRPSIVGCVVVAVTAGLAAVASAPPAAARTKATPARGDFTGRLSIGGGRKLFLQCRGTGGPTVILDSGIHDSSDPWTLTQTEPPVPSSPPVFDGVARFARVCRYDRPGTVRYTDPPALTTRSTPVRNPRSLTNMARDLRALLRRSRIPGPYLLVGHSYGGMIVRRFAQLKPGQVAGMVLADAFGTNIRELFGPELWPDYVELLNHPDTPFDSDPRFETADVDGAIDSLLNGPGLPPVPLAVLSKTEPFGAPPGVSPRLLRKLEEVWPKVQALNATLRPQTPHIFATGSDHYVQLHDPDLTTSAIRLIFNRARRPAPRVVIGGGRLRVGRSGRVSVRLACPPRARRSCAGRLRLSRGGATLGSRRFRLRVGRRAVVGVKLSRGARRLVRAKQQVGAVAAGRTTVPDGPARSARRRVVLVAR